MNEFLRRLLNLPEQASTYARALDTLHYVVIGATMLGATGVFLTALVLLVRYRQRAGDSGRTPRVRSSTTFEVVTIAGTLGMFLVFWEVGFRQYLHMREPPDDALEVYVTGKQWMWKFAYPAGPSSAGVLYAPVGRPVKLLMTSRDVIHSFFVPAFRMKQDVLPGRYTVAWFEATRVGVFPVYCAEFCGDQHSMMRADVVVLSPDDFERWLAHPATPPVGTVSTASTDTTTWAAEQREGLAAEGLQKAAEHGCLACHTLDGSAHIGPTWRGMYGRVESFTDGTQLRVDEAYITESMMDPLAKIVVGYAPVMPSYHGLIAPPDTAAIIEYIKTLDLLTPPPNTPTAPRSPVTPEAP